jgi:hypothetical protein
MKEITSVRKSVKPPEPYSPLGLAIAGMGFGVQDWGSRSITILVIFLLAFWVSIRKSHQLVMITMPSGETTALCSKDEVFVDRVIAALNKTIFHRESNPHIE